MTSGGRRQIIRNSVHCHTCNSVLVSISLYQPVNCRCTGDFKVSIWGGNKFLSLDLGYKSQYSMLHEFGELVD